MDAFSWFDTPNESLPYLLVKAGYDVWLGNDRGTKNSQRNANKLHPVYDAQKFWNFTYAELGEYDAIVNLNYIKEKVGANAIYYIGYAEGATSILYGMSRPMK